MTNSKSDLVTSLLERFGFPSEVKGDFMKMKKDALKLLEQNTRNDTQIAASDLSKAQPISDTSSAFVLTNKQEEDPSRPSCTSPDWTDFVLNQLTDEEKPNNRPTCDGLRRIFELLIGDIVEANTRIIKAPSISDNDATVEFCVVYRCYKTGLLKKITDAINVNERNTKSPWHLASVATATTKAESRALRKGLRLQKVLSSEETDQGFSLDDVGSISIEEFETPSSITSNQITLVNNLSGKLNIDPQKLLDYNSISSFAECTYEQAMALLNSLNKYQRGAEHGGEDIPEEILHAATIQS